MEKKIVKQENSVFAKAKWITLGSLPAMTLRNFDKLNGSIYFRKEFDVSKEVEKAELSICALGLGVCTINGNQVTDEVLSTPFTQYDVRVIYQTYDVTALLNTGANAIGVHVGNGFYNDNMKIWNDWMAAWKDNPKVIAALTITYKTGENEVVATSTSWRCTEGPAVYNHMRQGEMHDARLRRNDYDIPGFDDSQWQTAALAHEPGGILETTNMPRIKVIRTLKPASCKNDIYDFGENISGWARIKVQGEAGQEIKLTYDEVLNEDGTFAGACSLFAKRDGMPLYNQDLFICSGKEEEFRPSFCYHGFRYVKVENAPKTFEITAEVVHTDLKQIGSFTCSDEMLNKLHEASVRATLSNYMGMPTDCPHREQWGWTGDAQLSSEQALMNFDLKDAYAKWLRDFKDAQRPNGQLPGIIPTQGWGYNWGCGPSFDSAIIIIPYNVYINTGSIEIIEDVWENMVRYMGYFERMCIDGIADFGLGDWKPVRQPACPRAVTDTAYFYSDCMMMAEMASLLGEDSENWRNKAETSRRVWREKFLGNSELEQFQTFFACAVYQGMLDEEEIPAAVRKLAELVIENGYHIDCGHLGTKYIFNVLSEHGYIDVLYKMVTNPTFPGYGYWISQGHTTLCESWDMKESCNHHMFSEIDHWLYRHVGGIKYTKTGLVIQPVLLKNVDYVKAEHKGISVTRNGRKVSVVLPVSAKVIIDNEERMVPAGEYEFAFGDNV